MWRDRPGLFACDTSKDADHAALVVFVGGPLALRWREFSDAALRAEVTARLEDSARPGRVRYPRFQPARLDA